MFDPNNYRKAVLKPLLEGGLDTIDDPFALFDVDLHVDDVGVISARVDEVVAFWRKEQSSARYRNVAEGLLKQRDALSAQILDREARIANRARVVAQRSAYDAQRFADLDDMLARLNKRWGGIPSSRVERLRTTAQRGGVSGAEFDQRIGAFNLVDDIDDGEVVAPPASVRQLVRTLLGEFSNLNDDVPKQACRTLFDFVGVEPDANTAAVRAACQRISARNRQRRHDRLRTVVDELLALASDLLINGSNAIYIAGLAEDAGDSIRPQVEMASLVEDRLSAVEFERLLRTVMAAGIAAAPARSVVLRIARDVGVAVETGQSVDYVMCSACNTANPADGSLSRCEHCGANLYTTCPNCSRQVPKGAAICRACSYDLGAVRLARQAVTEVRAALASGLINDAAQRVDALNEWARDVTEVQALDADVAAAKRDAETKWAACTALLNTDRVDEVQKIAKDLLATARDVHGPNGQTAEQVLADVEQRIADIRTALGTALDLEGTAREQAVLDLADQYPTNSDVLAQLRQLPVSAPSRVLAMIGGDSVKISWKASPSPGAVSYRVSRHSIENGIEQARPIGSTTDTSLEDGGVSGGSTVSYEVQAVRHGITSGHVGTREQLVAFEVQKLVAVEHDGAIELRWAKMHGHDTVWVERSDLTAENAPTKRMGASDHGLLDADVVAEHRYSYRVFVEYGSGAARVATKGRIVTAAAFVVPLAPRLTFGASTERTITAHVESPTAGVVVRSSVEDPGLAPGAIIDARMLARIGTEVPVDESGVCTADNPGRPVWLIAAAQFQTQAVVGEAAIHPGLGEVKELRAAAEQGALAVRWQWPLGCTESFVVVRAGTPPVGVDDPAAICSKVTNTKYDIAGGWLLPNPAAGRLHVLVRPFRRVDNDIIALPGAPASARAETLVTELPELSYKVRRVGLRKRELRIDISTELPEHPRLMVMSRQADADDSTEPTIIGELPAGTASVTLPLEGLRMPAVILVRPAQGSADGFRITDPDLDQRTLSW